MRLSRPFAPAPLAGALLLGTLSFSLGCPASFRDCSIEDASAAEALPEALSETGLYSDIENGVISESAVEFKPRFPLWTDGATKRRWLLLPEGEQVDTSDPEDFDFPVGTKLFKDFTRDGILIETRMNVRNDDGWAAVSYLWNDAGDDAIKQLEPEVDAAGTGHDVPGATECLACHAGRRNFTLGFSSTQLDVEKRSELFEAGVLSHAVEGTLNLPEVVKEGLGVLHGNCAHCHNADRDLQAQATTCYAPSGNDVDSDLTLPHNLDNIENAPAFLTARFDLGEPGDSAIITRMSERNLNEDQPSMPPLGTELVDDDGIALVEAMIAELPPRQGR